MSNSESVEPNAWQRLPMPEKKARLPYERIFPFEEYDHICRGLKPETMEGKWFIYLEGDWIMFHRSWTGMCVYQVRLEREANGYKVAEAWVNRDPEEYSSKDDDYDALLLNWVIDAIILGREDIPCPMPPHLR